MERLRVVDHFVHAWVSKRIHALSCPQISTRRNSSGGNAAIFGLGVIFQHQVNISGNRIPGHNVNVHGSTVDNALGQLDFCWAMSPKKKNIRRSRL
jgi:hypothetical protein